LSIKGYPAHLRCLAVAAAEGPSLRNIVAAWRARFNNGDPFCDVDDEGHELFNLAWALPLPHALLCTVQQWRLYAVPAFEGRRGAGLGLHQVRGWLGLRVAAGAGLVHEDDDADDPDARFSPELLLQLCDVLRRCAEGLVVDMDMIKHHVVSLTATRQRMLRSQLLLSGHVYRMVRLLECMILSGMLKSATELSAAVHSSVRICITEPAVRDHFLGLLKKRQKLPKRSTIYRHRLAAHLCYCLMQQGLTASMLQMPGGVLVYGTMDASPQGGQDLMMIVFCTIQTSEVGVLYDAANALMVAGALQDPRSQEDQDRESDSLGLLTKALQLVPQLPTALGSGRANIIAKCHCLAHACRLMTPSWKACAAYLNSSVSFTGDLGVESHLPQVQVDLRSLFGVWVQQDDESRSV
jgi:hypothetical protein